MNAFEKTPLEQAADNVGTDLTPLESQLKVCSELLLDTGYDVGRSDPREVCMVCGETVARIGEALSQLRDKLEQACLDEYRRKRRIEIAEAEQERRERKEMLLAERRAQRETVTSTDEKCA